MIASSQVPLMRDSVVAFEVLQTKEGIHIRLLNQSPLDSAQTSNIQNRLNSLQLPNTPESQLVLKHFEQQSAPLDTNRLQQALQAVQQAPSGQAAQVAASHALLAHHQLPVTPALLQIAQSAISPNPNPVQLLPQLIQQLQQGMQPNGQTAQNNATLGANNTQSPAHITGQNTANPNAQQQAPAAPSAATQHPAAANPLTSTQPSAALNAAQQGAQATATSNNAIIQAGQNALQTFTQILQQDPGNSQQMQHILQLNGIHNTTTVNAEQTTIQSSTQTTVDPINEQQQAIKNLVNELAKITQLTQQLDPAQQQNDTLKQIVRDVSADTIFKPQHLHDYDAVLPLLMQDQGEAQHARIAIAKRPIPGQQEQATFLRVDLELQQLGPLSLRMSSGNGPIVITVFATGYGLEALQQGQEDLLNDLQEKHIEAHIRIADLLEHEEALHG